MFQTQVLISTMKDNRPAEIQNFATEFAAIDYVESRADDACFVTGKVFDTEGAEVFSVEPGANCECLADGRDVVQLCADHARIAERDFYRDYFDRQ